MTTTWLVLAGIAVVLGVGAIVSARRRRALRRALMDGWGIAPERRRDLERIAAYHRFRAGEDGSRPPLDDRTWSDLDLDLVFAALDHTTSSVGRQILYHRLRTGSTPDERRALRAVADLVTSDAAARGDALLALSRLASSDAYRLWRLTVLGAIPTGRWFAVFPVLAGLVLVSAAAIPFWPQAVLVLIAAQVVNMATRAAVSWRLAAVLIPVRQIEPLVRAAEELLAVPGLAEAGGHRLAAADVGALTRLRRVARWSGRERSGQDELTGMLLELLNLLLLLDANALFFGGRELARKRDVFLRVLDGVGSLDFALAVASYRAGAGASIVPAFVPPGAELVITDARHPLLAEPVPNPIRLPAGHGLLLTGSNMSGKSTYVRTIGVAVVMAQALDACLAAGYAAPELVVASCIGRADNLVEGKSYYLAEVEAVLTLVRAAETSTPHLLLFDELFRGTNVIERLAAGESVLRAIAGPGKPHYVIAATHDGELVPRLAGAYLPFHFEGRIGPAGLEFDYRLAPGPASTRNAIDLLELNGAPAEIVELARRRAEELDRERGSGLPA